MYFVSNFGKSLVIVFFSPSFLRRQDDDLGQKMVVACFTLFKEAGASKDRRTRMKQESYLKLQRSSQMKKEAIHGLALVLNWESLTLMLIYLQTSSQESEANYLVSNLVSPKPHWKWNMKRCQRPSSKELDANEIEKNSWTDFKHGPDVTIIQVRKSVNDGGVNSAPLYFKFPILWW